MRALARDCGDDDGGLDQESEEHMQEIADERDVNLEDLNDTSPDYASDLMESPGPGIGEFFYAERFSTSGSSISLQSTTASTDGRSRTLAWRRRKSPLIADNVDSMDWKPVELFPADTPYGARPTARIESEAHQPEILKHVQTRYRSERARSRTSDTLPMQRKKTEIQLVYQNYRLDSKRQKQSFSGGFDSKDSAVVSCANLREEDLCPAATGYTRELLCLVMDTLQSKYTSMLSNITLYVFLPVLVTAVVFGELLISPECPWILLPVVSIMTFRLNIIMARTVKGYGIPELFLQWPGSKFGLWHIVHIFEYMLLPSSVSQALYTSQLERVDQLFSRSAASTWPYVYGVILQELVFWAYPASDYRSASASAYHETFAEPSTKNETRLWTRILKGFEKSTCRAANHLWTKTHEYFHTVMSAVGCVEPPLAHGYLRLRWTCKCGDAFWSDLTEYRTGGARKVAERIESVAGVKVTVASYNATSTNQKWTFQVPRRIRNLMWRSGARADNQPKLPQHSLPTQASSSTTSTCVGASSSVGSSLRLLACIHRTQDHMHLLQEPIDQVNNDLSLFQYMEKQLKRHRRRIRQLLSLRSIRGVHLVKFHLRTGNLVEVREHRRYCVTVAPPNIFTQTPSLSNHSTSCNCIPPEPKREPAPNAEYRCTIDEQDLGAGPPVDPKFLLHMLNSTDCINQDSKSIFNILPRRIGGQLNGGDLKPAVGWGIYYEEGLNADVVINIALAVLVLGSLLFGILWSVLEMDIQGAFGVSSYMVTASGIIIAWVASQAKNFG